MASQASNTSLSTRSLSISGIGSASSERVAAAKTLAHFANPDSVSLRADEATSPLITDASRALQDDVHLRQRSRAARGRWEDIVAAYGSDRPNTAEERRAWVEAARDEFGPIAQKTLQQHVAASYGIQGRRVQTRIDGSAAYTHYPQARKAEIVEAFGSRVNNAAERRRFLEERQAAGLPVVDTSTLYHWMKIARKRTPGAVEPHPACS